MRHPLTRSFQDTVDARAARDPEFRAALKQEALEERIQLAVSVILAPGYKAPKVAKGVAVQALNTLIEEAQKAIRTLTFDPKTTLQKKEERIRAMKAAKEQAPARYSKLIQTIDVRVGEEEKEEKITAAGKMFERLYDTVMLRGRAIGGVWYHELNTYHAESAFEASLCKQLLMHGTPEGKVRIRDFVSARDLASMVKKAVNDSAATLRVKPTN